MCHRRATNSDTRSRELSSRRGRGWVARGRGTDLLLEVMNARGQVLLGTSPVVEISLTLALEDAMRLIIDVDDESLTRAAALTGMDDHVALIRRAIELLVRIESGRQLGALGGSDPVAEAAPRSRERA